MTRTSNFLLLIFIGGLYQETNAWALSPRANGPRQGSTSRLFLSSAAPAATTTPSTAGTTQVHPLNDMLLAALCKPSKTLAVILDVNTAMSTDRVDVLSMQLRKTAVTALSSNNLHVVTQLVQEQTTAQGSFPGPCPVLYTGSDHTQEALVTRGIDAVVVDASYDFSTIQDDNIEAAVIYKVTTVDQVEQLAHHNAFIIHAKDVEFTEMEHIIKAMPPKSVVTVVLDSMQNDNAELTQAKRVKEWGATAILLQRAIVGDKEDLEYASFAVDGLTKKKSSTFNMSGLTGTTNGHFGGVSPKVAKTWKRQQS